MKTSRTRLSNRRLGILALSWLLTFFGAEPGNAEKYPQYKVDGTSLTMQEEWVLDRAKSGDAADLIDRLVQQKSGKVIDLKKKNEVLASLLAKYGISLRQDEGLPDLLNKLENLSKEKLTGFWETTGKELTIRAEFLEQLLTDGFPGLKIHYHGVDLRNVIISGQLDLRGAEVSHEVKLRRCIVEELNLWDSNFKKNLQILSSHIRKNAMFLGIKVGKCAYFNNCIFNQEVNFNRAQIGEEFSAMGARFNSASMAAHFDNLRVTKNTFFEKAIFHGELNFRMAQIDGILDMYGATFLKKANFDSLKVAHSINFDGTLFEDDVHFPKLKVGNFADFRHAVFKGEAWFGGGDIGVDFRAPRANFLNPDKYASFFALKVGREVNFDSVVFKGPVDFGSADIGVNLKAPAARFENGNPKHPAMEGPDLKVGNVVDLTSATFTGKAIFSGAKIGGLFDASMARFESEEGVDFSGMRVGRFHADVKPGAFFEGVQLRGPVSFSGGRFYDLTITGPVCHPPNLSQLNLEQVVVERNLNIQNVIVEELAANNLQAKGQTTLTGIEIKKKANLSNSSFMCLEMSEVMWPEPGREKLLLSGMSYQSIKLKNDPPGNWLAKVSNWLHPSDPLLDRIDNSDFDARNYVQLQGLFQRTGQENLADQTYIKMKQREGGLDSWEAWLNPLNWPKLFFWDLAVGYGRKPLRILWSGLAIIAIGACFFDPKYLIRMNWVKRNKFFNVVGRLLLSFDMFTPSLLNLGIEKNWVPPVLSGRLKIIIFLHKLAGRVFIAVFFVGVWAKFK